MPYRYVLDQTVDEMIAALTRREGRMLRDFFRFLAGHPFTEGEQRVEDRDARLCEVKVLDRFVITYRPDHAAREVRILAVEIT